MASAQELELPATDMVQEDEVTYALEEVELEEATAGNAEDGDEGQELSAGQEYHDPSSTTQTIEGVGIPDSSVEDEEYDEVGEMERLMTTEDEEVHVTQEVSGEEVLNDEEAQTQNDYSTEEDATTEDEDEDERPPGRRESNGTDITYLVRLTDDGAICLDQGGLIPMDAEPHTYFSITLPTQEVKSVLNPIALPVAPSSSRSRKTKPQALLYNDESDQVIEVLADGSITPIIQGSDHVSKHGDAVGLGEMASSGTIDLSDIESQFNSRDIATLETVLQSEQAQALLANLDLTGAGHGQGSSGSIGSRGTGEPGTHLWDHSYSTVLTSTATSLGPPTLVQHSLSGGRPKTTISINYGTDVFKSPVDHPIPVAPKAMTTSRAKAGPPQLNPRSNQRTEPSSREGSSTPSSSSGAQADKAAAAAAAAAGRRSLRQQDRFERLEAERILAENQEMLLREKQQLQAAAAGTKVSPMPLPPGQSPAPVKDQSVAIITPDKTANSPQSTGGSGRSASASSRPRRENRKLPAHLADPNYVQLEAGEGDGDVDMEDGEGEGKSERKKSEGTNDQDSAGDEEMENNEEDDPNKLWCICRRPHNNRFMICCDKCEDWFHGNCVGVTKVQGKVFEEQMKTWLCPHCKKKVPKKDTDLEEDEDTSPTRKGSAKSARKLSAGKRRSSSKRETSPDITTTSPVSNRKSNSKRPATEPTPPAQTEPTKSGRRKSDTVTTPVVSSTSTTPKTAAQVTPKTIPKAGAPSKSASTTESTPESHPTLCIVCKAKPARPDSVYCGDQCVVAHSQKSSASAAASTATTPKLKRASSKPEGIDDSGNFLAFHVISTGASKSTAVVPARQKELTASALLKQQQEEQKQLAQKQQPPPSPTKTVPAVTKQDTPLSQPSSSRRAKQGSESSEPKKSGQTQSSVSSSTRSSRLNRQDSNSKPTASPNHKRGNSESTSDSKGSDSRSNRRSSASKPSSTATQASGGASSKKDLDADEAARENFRTSITQAFSSRIQGMPEEEQKLIPKKNTAETMGRAIEEELFIAFGNSTNQKYRNKCRSIVFNLKDLKNSLHVQILTESLKPKDLARMDSHQLASAELTEWRLQEQKKELDIIQRAELEKLQEARRQELLDSGAEIDKVVQVAPISTDISDLIEETDEAAGKKGVSADEAVAATNSKDKDAKKDDKHSKHSKSSSSSTDKDKDKSRSSDKDRDKSHHHRSSSRHASSSSKDKEKEHNHHRRSERHSHRKSESIDSGSGTPSDSKDKEKDKRSSDRSSDRSKDKDKKDTNKRDSSKDRSHHHKTRSSERHKPESRKSSSSTKEEPAKPTSTVEKEKPKEDVVLPVPPPPKKSKAIDLYESIAESVEKSGAAGSKLGGTGPPSISSLDDLSRTSFTNEETSVSSGSVSTTGEKSEGRSRWSVDSSEQELPSSTIKTPEFETHVGLRSSSGSSGKKEEKPVQKAKFVMPELGQFNAAMFNVSHTKVTGLYFPSSPVPIVGRIGPDTVWDYIDKMKKSKELIVFRLAPATPADAETYMSFFTYFSSRGRLGVLGGIHSPLKDVYLVPLDKHSPVNRVLLPFRGPGLPKDRPHCLLAVVTRNEVGGSSLPASIAPKRKPSPPALLHIDTKKKFKPGDSSSSSGHYSSSRSSRRTSSLEVNKVEKDALSKAGNVEPKPSDKPGSVTAADMDTTEAEDDKPYEPWEEDDDDICPPGTEPTTIETSVDTTAKPTAAKKAEEANCEFLLAQLDAQIRSERLAIQSIASSIATSSIIPGLDGEFSPVEGTSSSPAVPFFLQSPQSQHQAVVTGAQPQPHLMDIDERITTNSAVPLPVPVTVPDEAPYSPSAMEFTSDDEDEGGSSRVSKPTSSKPKAPPIVVSLDSSPSSDDEPEAVGIVMGSSSASSRPIPGFKPMSTTELEQEQSTGQTWSISPFKVGGSTAGTQSGSGSIRPGTSGKININLINPTNNK